VAARVAATITVAKARTLARARVAAKAFNLTNSLEGGAANLFHPPFLIHARKRIQ
jgi:hypothetical protein